MTAQTTISSSSSHFSLPLKARKRNSIFELSVIFVVLVASANTPFRAQAQSPVAPSPHSATHAVPPQAPNAINAITGIAFRDKNSDGKRDAGEPGIVGIVVTTYGTDGTTRGTATTAGDGSYSLAATGAGPYRVEFTNYPVFMRPGPQGTDSGTTVQFVADGNATQINVNFVNPDDFVGPTVNLATTLFVAGTQTGTKPTLVQHPYAVDSPTGVEQVPLALENQIGTTYGLAYQRSNKTLYAASFVKRGTGFGPGGIGAIYKVPISGTPSVLVNIGSAAGSFSKPRDLNPDPPDFDSEAVTLTAKTGFGDLDITEDESTLYTINLANRSLYKIDVAAASEAPGGTAGVTLIGTSPDPGCVGGVARPFALEIKDGVVYVGGMCTGELGPTLGNTETVEAYVYTYTAVSGWGSQPVLRFPMAYPTTCADVDAAYDPNKSCNRPGAIGSVADWWSWSDQFPLRLSAGYTQAYTFNSETQDGFIISPEPILSDIEINGTDMILGIRDRFGDQAGWDDPGPLGLGNSPFSGTVNMRMVPKADILRASPEITQAIAQNANGPEVTVLKWKIEGNASGSTFGPGAHPNDGSGPCNGVQGPIGQNCGEFYDDNFNPDAEKITGHDEVALGALAQVEGAGEVALTAYDPFAFESAGTMQLSNVNGARVRGFQLYVGGSFRTPGDYLNKANGMGDLEVLTEAAPVEIGNLVWRDTNTNGLQDPGEPGIAGVTVSLYRPGFGADCVAGNADDSQPVAKAVTDAKGEYYFRTGAGADAVPTDAVGLLNGAVCGMTPFATYTLKLDNAPDFTAGQPLGGLFLTESNDAVPSPGGSNNSDSDAKLVGAVPVITYTVGGPGGNDHRLDFGFSATVISYSVGNEVWLDTNNNKVIDPSETGLAGVTVTLHHDANANGTIDSAELSPTATMATNAQGFYLFTVNQVGSYAACVVSTNFSVGSVLSGHLSSGESVGAGGVVTETSSASPDSDVDNDDNGTRQTGAGSFCSGGVASALMSVTGNEPSTEVPANVPATLAGATPGITDTAQNINSNVTLDFGFYIPVASPQVSVGNQVWIDANNNSTLDAGEAGVNGVAMQLYCDSNNSGGYNAGDALISSTVTAGGGFYVFSSLTPTGASCSGYVAIVTGANFCAGQPLAGYLGSTGSVTSNSDQNSKDHGLVDGTTTCNQPVLSTPVSVTVGTEPTNDGDADTSSNLSLDFGFYMPTASPLVSVGNQVWVDANNNSTLDAGEAGVDGVAMQLYCDSNNSGGFNAGDVLISSTVTAGGGLYLFSGLTPTGASCSGYVAIVTGANFCTGQPLAGYLGSTGNVTSNTDQNNKDHGIDGATACNQPVLSTPVSVTVGTEPSNDGDADTSSNLTLDFGFYLPASLGNRVWFDANKNGQQDDNEVNVPGITVTLRSPSGAVLSTTLTNASGLYSFTNLVPGTYAVCFELPVGRGMTTKGMDGQSDTDSNADPTTNCTGPVTLTSGQNNPTLDVGIIVIGPTAVRLTQFATARANNGINVVWTTGSELNTFGFALYRAERSERSMAVLVTQELIAAKGASDYAYFDRTAASDVTYYYWLIETETTGAMNEYGPVQSDIAPVSIGVQPVSQMAVAGGIAAEVRVDNASSVVAAEETITLNPSTGTQAQSAVQVMARTAALAAVQDVAQPVSHEVRARQWVQEQSAPIVPAQKTQAAASEAVVANAPEAATKGEAGSNAVSVSDAPAAEQQVVVATDRGVLDTKPAPTQAQHPALGLMWVALGIAIAGALFMMGLGACLVFVARRRNKV